MKMAFFTKVLKEKLFNLTEDKILKVLLLVFLVQILFVSCYNSDKPATIEAISDKNIDAILLADTIIYDVLIKNPDPENEWTDYCLQNLDKDKLISFVFEGVYNGKFQAYHYYTNKKLSISKVKKIENDPAFSRDAIAKIQFVERWVVDKNNFRLLKQVHSIMLGYEALNSDGEIKGYKPTFRIYLP